MSGACNHQCGDLDRGRRATVSNGACGSLSEPGKPSWFRASCCRHDNLNSASLVQEKLCAGEVTCNEVPTSCLHVDHSTEEPHTSPTHPVSMRAAYAKKKAEVIAERERREAEKRAKKDEERKRVSDMIERNYNE